MSKKYVLILLLALSLSACTRAASSAPLATPTLEANFPQPVVTTSGMNAIEVAGTQTAIATAGLPVPQATGNATQQPVANPTFTPLGSTALPSLTPGAIVNTAVPQPTAQVGKPASYTLKEGEFVYCIARRFNLNPDELLSLNGVVDSQTVYPGLTLKIPQSANIFPGQRALKAHPAQYIVRSGDTTYSVACLFGDVDPASIAAANNLGGAYNLTTGTTIQIP
jgi:LysM repeat protein